MCVTRTVKGMGQSSSSAHKDITRLFRGYLTDRSMEVRKAATEVRDMKRALHVHYSQLSCGRGVQGGAGWGEWEDGVWWT